MEMNMWGGFRKLGYLILGSLYQGSDYLRYYIRVLTQRLQYPLVKEYTLNHNKDPTIIYGILLN